MTSALRLLFDDCLSKHAVSALKTLAAFTGGAVQFAHIADFNLSGQRDDEWIPKVAADRWIIVTTDRGKKPSRGGKLPLVCQRNSITYIMLTGRIHQRNTFDKIRAIFGVWYSILAIDNEKQCSGHTLGSAGGDSVKLTCVYPEDGEGDAAEPTQRDLGLHD